MFLAFMPCVARKGESRKGHYSVRDCVLELTHLADPSSETEVRALFPDAPTLRPADIYTCAALPGRMAALDIGICRPDVCKAGEDRCDSMYRDKIKRYNQFLVGRTGPGFDYCPLVFSCYGRVHLEFMSILQNIAQGVARRRGLLDFRGFIARARRNVGVAIWKRVALVKVKVKVKVPIEPARARSASGHGNL